MFAASRTRRPLLATAMIVASLLGTTAGIVAAATAATIATTIGGQAVVTATHSAHVLADGPAGPDDTPWG